MGTIKFKCTRCDNIDIDTTVDTSMVLCTRCLTGEWHNHFKETKYIPGVTKGLNNVSDTNDANEDEGPSFG